MLETIVTVFLVVVFFAMLYFLFEKQKKIKKIKQAEKKNRKQQQREERRQLELRRPAEVIKTSGLEKTLKDQGLSPQGSKGRPSLILLVEDSPTMLLALRKILERWNYRVVTAEDGKAAWAQLQKLKPDLVISDIDMPYLNGIELLQLIRNDILFMNIPVILITGNANLHFQATQQAGVNGLLSKPFEDKALVDQVRYILQE